MLSCPVCHDIILVTEHSSCTPCGHVFHETCLNKWLTDNRNCPHCRQPCTLVSIHRLYLPDSHFEKSDIMEKLTEVAIAKENQEKQIKDLEKNNKKLEFELKVKKKQYQKILNRSRRLGKHSKTINIPRAGQNNSNISTATTSSTSIPVASTSQATHNESQTAATKTTRTAQERSKKRRNVTRVNRAKEYFRRKKAFYENTTNNNNNNNQAPVNNDGGGVSVAGGSGNVITI